MARWWRDAPGGGIAASGAVSFGRRRPRLGAISRSRSVSGEGESGESGEWARVYGWVVGVMGKQGEVGRPGSGGQLGRLAPLGQGAFSLFFYFCLYVFGFLINGTVCTYLGYQKIMQNMKLGS